MNFLNPIYLFALAAVAIPILIHIFSRRRVPQVPFSSIRFLNPSDRRSMVRINLRRLLLLALRIIGIALVALVFARPVVRGSLATLFPSGGSRAACILLDRSFSMGVASDEGTAFERAASRLASVLDNLEKDDEVSIVLFDTAREAAYDGALQRDAVRAVLKDLHVSWGGTDLKNAVAFARAKLEGSRRDVRELYLISDLQKTGLGSASDTTARRAPLRAFILPVQTEAAGNVAVEEVLTPRVALHKGETVQLKVRLRNTSRELAARFPLEVSVGGRRIMEKEINMPAASATDETVVFPADWAGWVEGVVKKRPDRLSADDTRYFTLHVEEKVGVLLLANETGYYLAQALSPAGVEGDISLVEKRWREFTSAELRTANVVVLGPGGSPSPGDVELIDRFVSAGGKAVVLVIPGLEGVVSKLSRVSPRIGFTEMPQGYFSIMKPPVAPSFLAPFNEEDLAALSRIKFRKAAIVANVPERDVLLRFGTGTPFIWQESRGAGTLVFAAIDPTPSASDLVLSPYFLPLVQQLVLATGPRAPAGGGSLIGESIVWRTEPGENVTCRLPGGAEIKPEQAPERIGRDAVIIPPVEEPGFVTILQGGEVKGKIAVNPDCRKESDLGALAAKQAADSLGLESTMIVQEGRELTPAVHTAREGREISMPLILAAILVFVAEGIIAQREKGDTK